MSLQQHVQEAFVAAGDPATAFLWRRLCRDLQGPLRIGLAGANPALIARVLPEVSASGHEIVVLHHDEGDGQNLGTIDRLLGVHVVIWATPYTSALTQTERDAMVRWSNAGAPAMRVVWLVERDLLESVSDEPEREAREVEQRVDSLLSEWSRVADPGAFLAKLERREQTSTRVREVAGVLFAEAHARAVDALARVEIEQAGLTDLMGAADADLAAARERGTRTARSVLSAVRVHTRQLLVDLRGMLVDLENDLRAQIEQVDSVEVVRRTLPHWLHHVVRNQLSALLDAWQSGVLQDVENLELSEHDLRNAQLLVPALYAPPMSENTNWSHRIGATATAGAGAALLLFGLWVPGLITLTGGIAWSAVARALRGAETREALIITATESLREMGTEAEELLQEQLDDIEIRLASLPKSMAAAIAEGLADQRAAWREQQIQLDQRRSELQRTERRLAAASELGEFHA